MSTGGRQPRENVIREVPVVWVDLDQTPIEFLNQFAIQKEGDEYILSLGALAPPFLLGDDEDRRKQAAELRFVPVHVLGRYGMTATRLKEFAVLLTGFLEQHESGEKRK